MIESPMREDVFLQRHSLSRPLTMTPLKSSLQLSPKRGLLFSANKPTFAQTPVAQSSLLQSPARRPLVSPTKSIFALSPVKSVRKQFTVPNTGHGEFMPHYVSSEKAGSSPLRADRSNKSVSRPHMLTPDNQEVNPVKESNRTSDLNGDGLAVPLGKPDVSRESSTPSNILRDGDVFEPDFETLAKSSPIVDNTVADTAATESPETEQAKAEARSTTPPGRPRRSIVPDADVVPISFREAAIDADSEDELSSPTKSGFGSRLSTFGISSQDYANPFTKRFSISPTKVQPGTMTPLTAKLGSWAASSPQKFAAECGKAHGVAQMTAVADEDPVRDDVQSIIMERSPEKLSQFDEQMDIHNGIEEETSVILSTNTRDEQDILKASMESSSSTEYGDENEIPLDPVLFVEESAAPKELTCIPARVFETREIHTVSKVPLRPADDEASPLIITKKRSKSISGRVFSSKIPQSSNLKRNSLAAFPDRAISLPNVASAALEQERSISTPTKQPNEADEYDLLAHVASPIGSSRKLESSVLKGVTAFVDVHTSEGADASGIFHDLLSQMGAKCVKQWNWNPRASIAHGAESVDEDAGPNKPGITHVIYKDGGKRTLEKVRAAKGAVDCVGVGWVLE